MKLNAIILTTALMMTASMQAMKQNEKTAILPVPQSIPADDLRQQVFKLKKANKNLQTSKKSNERTARCLTAIGVICCCPCLTLEWLCKTICPTITININTNQQN